MPWLQPRRERQIEPLVVYVPVTQPDKRPHSEKWRDERYLESVVATATGDVWIGEVMESLGKVRACADAAKTPDELRGCQAGIRALTSLLTIGTSAKSVLVKQAELSAAAEEGGSDGRL